MQQNSLTRIFKTLRHQEQMIISSNMYDKTYLQVSLKEFLKLFKCLASSGIHTVSRWLDLLFKALHQERKRRKEIIPTRLSWAPRVMVVLPLFIHIWYEVFDGYYVAYKPITLSCILFMFIEMKFIHCHSCVMFVMKSMSMCND